MIIQTILLSLIAFFVAIVLYFIGNTFINIILKSSISCPRNIFYSIFWGSILTVTITAIIATRFSTIFLIIIIPIILFTRAKISVEAISWKTWRWYIFLIPLLFFVTTLWLQFFPYGANVEQDMPFYSKISIYLFKSGIENTQHYFNENVNHKIGNTPYHYFELWFNGLIKKCLSSHYSSMFVLRMFTIPFFIVLMLIGYMNFLKQNNSIKIFVLSIFFIILVTFINYTKLVNFGKPSWGISNHFFTRSNFVFFYFSLLPAFHSLLKQQNNIAFVGYLLLIPIISITTAPAIFVGIVVWALIQLKFKTITKSEVFKIFGYTFASAICIYIFYLITGNKVQSLVIDNNGLIGIIKYNLLIWKAIIHQIVTLSLRSLLFISIPFVIVYKFRKDFSSNIFSLFLFSIITSFVGIVIFQSISTTNNAYQIPYIGYTSIGIMFNLAIFILFEKINNYKKIPLFGFFSVILVLTKMNHIQTLKINEYIETQYLELRGIDNSNIDMFNKKLKAYPDKIIKAGYIKSDMRKPIVYQTGNLLYMLSDQLQLYPITPLSHFDPEDKTIVFNKLKQKFPFYANYNTTDEIEYINQYIRENELQFIFSEVEFEDLIVDVFIIK